MTTFYALTAWKGGLGVTVTILIPDRRTAATLGWCSNKKMAGSQCVECRAVVHRVLSHCLFCKCLFAKTLRQRMADLPYDSHSSMSTCVFSESNVTQVHQLVDPGTKDLNPRHEGIPLLEQAITAPVSKQLNTATRRMLTKSCDPKRKFCSISTDW